MKRLFLLPLIFSLVSPVQAESQKEFKPATKAEMNLYLQTAVSDFCLSRKSKISFSVAINNAASKYALAVAQNHKSRVVEIPNTTLTSDQIYNAAVLQTIDGAIRFCPNSVPNREKKKFADTLKRLNQSKS
tara:strand:+ start:569 stop:961 length:393 start_codon:yes stop_codon:yes gene_type:complete